VERANSARAVSQVPVRDPGEVINPNLRDNTGAYWYKKYKNDH